MIISLTENQLNQVQYFINKLNKKHNKDNFFVGACGEIAVHNYGVFNNIYKNLFGNLLINSILKPTNIADNGYDLILQSYTNPYIKIIAQIKTIKKDTNGKNLLLSKKLYDSQLNYYNNIPQDIFILVKQLSKSTYDILGYITRYDAINYYIEDVPVNGCYNINLKYLTKFENINLLFS